MIDTKTILALALLLGSLSLKIAPGGKPPAGGVPPPQHGIDITRAQ
jgi:hypothetical protein